MHKVEQIISEAFDAVEWSMNNCLPAKGETSAACEKRRLKEELIVRFEASLSGNLPVEVYEFVSRTCLLATNHGGWFDKHGFEAISPLCDAANAILEKYDPEASLSDGWEEQADFIFAWFNDRDPDAMVECLKAYHALTAPPASAETGK
ncbi:MAG: hypothetical protein ACRCYS_02110 [Beijerinckiaceae bacterium]